MAELHKIDIKEGKFECGGKMYYISETLSFARYEKLQDLLIEFAYSASVQDIFIALRAAYEKLNAQKFADASVAIHNIMAGIEKIDKKKYPALQICALFCNVDGEDLTTCSDAMINGKLESWGKELDVTPFFHFAVALLPEWMAALNVYTQTILDPAQKAQA